MGAKAGVFTVGAWQGQTDKVIEQLSALNVYVGKFSSEERLLQAAEKGLLTHLLVSQEGALNAPTIVKLKAANVQILTFRDAGRLL
jgi:hypothetical protein